MNTKLNESRLQAEIHDGEQAFVEIIRSRLGIIIHRHQYQELHKTIAKACLKFDCPPRDYLKIISDCPADSPYLEHLVAGVTIGETYFFRDKNQMQLLEQEILPELIAKKRAAGNLNLRIWSAGCASGEEIYTLSILLHELLPDLASWTIHLLGTDINLSALKKALAGSYKEWSMRCIDASYKNRYFSKSGNEYWLSESVKSLANFFYLNLNDDSYPSIINGTNAQDLILCRNVLIYFDSQRIHSLMKRFSLSLVEDGYLMLGASDPIDLEEKRLKFHYLRNALFSRTMDAIELPAPPLIKPAAAAPKRAPQKAAAAPAPRRIETQKLDEQSLQNLLDQGQWQELLDRTYLSKAQSPFILNAIATALANLGQLTQATQICENSLAIDKSNKKTHFLRAMILLELNQIEAAESALRTTLFLDHRFVFAHFQLGLLLLRNKKRPAGIQCLKNALSIAKTQKPDQEVTGVNGMHYARLVEILEQELELNSTYGSKTHETHS